MLGPRLDDIGPGSQDKVEVVGEFGMEADFDPEQGGQALLEAADPVV